MPQTTAAPSLRKVIEIYRAQHNEELDEHADKLLKRLADSPKAAKAFKRLQPKDDYDEAAIVRERQSAGARAFLNRMKKGNPQAARAIEQQLKLEDRGKPQWPYPQSPPPRRHCEAQACRQSYSRNGPLSPIPICRERCCACRHDGGSV